MIELWLPAWAKAFFVLGGAITMKEFKSYDEQIELLKARGLKINDENFYIQKRSLIKNIVLYK